MLTPKKIKKLIEKVSDIKGHIRIIENEQKREWDLLKEYLGVEERVVTEIKNKGDTISISVGDVPIYQNDQYKITKTKLVKTNKK